MKNICFIFFDLSVLAGGEVATCNVINSLADKYNVHVISLKRGENIYPLDSRVKCYNVGLEFSRIRKAIIPAVKPLRRYLKKNKVSLVFLTGMYASAICSVSSFFMGARYVFCDHEALMNRWDDRELRIIRTVASRIYSHIFVLTSRSRRDYIKMLKVNEKKISVMPNWVECISDLEYNTDSKLIISAGRFADMKGFHTIMPEIAKKVKEKHPDWQWHIYGDGEYFEKAKQKIEELDIQDFLILKGRTDKLNELYKNYSFMVMTSNREGLPLVLLEAKGNKLPAVAFDVITGPSEIIRDGVDGFLIDYPDTEAMAEKICRLIEDKDLRKKMSDATSDDIGRFSKETILQKWIDFIESH